MQTHKGPCRQPRGKFQHLSRISPKVGFFDALQEIANGPGDVNTICRVMRPIIGVRTVNPITDPKVMHPIDPLLLPDEALPLRNMVIDCLTSIARGERSPWVLRLIFEKRFAHAKRPQAIALTGIDPFDGRPCAFFTGALSEIVFQELVRLAKSPLPVARCALHIYPGDCRHFFFPDNETAASCTKACADRRTYLKWPTVPKLSKKTRQKHA